MVEEDEGDAVPGVTPVHVEPESGDAEPPTVEPVEVDAISDFKDAEPVVCYGVGSLLTPPSHATDSLSLQVDLKKDEPVPSEGLIYFLPGGATSLTPRRACGGTR